MKILDKQKKHVFPIAEVPGHRMKKGDWFRAECHVVLYQNSARCIQSNHLVGWALDPMRSPAAGLVNNTS
jgi:hypothetical protein